VQSHLHRKFPPPRARRCLQSPAAARHGRRGPFPIVAAGAPMEGNPR